MICSVNHVRYHQVSLVPIDLSLVLYCRYYLLTLSYKNFSWVLLNFHFLLYPFILYLILSAYSVLQFFPQWAYIYCRIPLVITIPHIWIFKAYSFYRVPLKSLNASCRPSRRRRLCLGMTGIPKTTNWENYCSYTYNVNL